MSQPISLLSAMDSWTDRYLWIGGGMGKDRWTDRCIYRWAIE